MTVPRRSRLEQYISSYNGSSGWNISSYNRIRSNLTTISKLNISNHLGTRTEENSFAHLRSREWILLKINPQRHLLKNCDIILDASIGTYYNSVHMWNIYPPTDDC